MSMEDINLVPLNQETQDIAQQVIDEKDVDRTRDLVQLFNLNVAKKNVVRILKLNGLLDSVSDTMIDRFEKHPGEFSNEDLLKYMQVIQQSIDNANKNLNLVDQTQAITLNQNNQVNVNIIDTLDRDSKERIADAVKAILNKANEQNNIIEVQEETENGNNENNQ